MRTWRVFQANLPQEAGEIVTLGPEESHHIARVLRLASGDRVEIFDGKHEVWQASVASVSKSNVSVCLERKLAKSVEAPLTLRLYQGLCRLDKMDGIVQKLTEVGAASIDPLNCRRAERFPPPPRRLERWRRIAIESCKQSGRHRVPTIEPRSDLPTPVSGQLALLLAPDEPALNVALEDAPPAEVWLAVGPESGFDPDELQHAVARGWRAVSLGPRMLRTEGAGFAAAAIVLHRLADLGR